jgi:hypothetical protein
VRSPRRLLAGDRSSRVGQRADEKPHDGTVIEERWIIFSAEHCPFR